MKLEQKTMPERWYSAEYNSAPNPRADLRPNPRLSLDDLEGSAINRDTAKTFSKAASCALVVGEAVLVLVIGYHLYVSYADVPLAAFTLLAVADIGVSSFLIYRLFRHGRKTVARLRGKK